MRRIIRFSVMGEKAFKLKQQIEELKQLKMQLLNDINKINESYKGEDATLIIQMYNDKTKEIDSFINIMEKYQICLEWLSGRYRDSHNKAVNTLININSNGMIESIMGTETININGINSMISPK